MLYSLNSDFNAVVDKEVDGDNALPARMEANPLHRISQLIERLGILARNYGVQVSCVNGDALMQVLAKGLSRAAAVTAPPAGL